jgi:hypothetical protein
VAQACGERTETVLASTFGTPLQRRKVYLICLLVYLIAMAKHDHKQVRLATARADILYLLAQVRIK